MKDLVNKGLRSNSFAKHPVTYFPTKSKTVPNNIHARFDVEILWHRNHIRCTKSFGRLTCSLCIKERLENITTIYKEPGRLINSNNELYGSCRHKPRFNRYAKTIPPSADEVQKEIMMTAEKNRISQKTMRFIAYNALV